MNKEKNYIASSIKKVTTQYGDLFNANIKLDDLKKNRKKRLGKYNYSRTQTAIRKRCYALCI